jgi:hypothetical protein
MTKQHILEEIKRVALENGGKSPGRLSFYNRTSIREADWMGKYWSRWNDAIREAGLSPNQMNLGYDESFLIGKFIELTRELGRLPVSGELRLKAYHDKTFPSMRTFEKRLGQKDQLVSKIAVFCRQNGDLEDIFRMCDAALKSKGQQASEADLAGGTGIVYLIKSGRFYKIGKTNSIGRREYDLAIQLAEKPATVHLIKSDDPDGIEAYWHRRFAVKRKGGEWFNLSASEVKAFKLWKRIA